MIVKVPFLSFSVRWQQIERIVIPITSTDSTFDETKCTEWPLLPAAANDHSAATGRLAVGGCVASD